MSGILSQRQVAALIVIRCGRIPNAYYTPVVAQRGALTWIGMKGWMISLKN
jgi:hypothetical protein